MTAIFYDRVSQDVNYLPSFDGWRAIAILFVVLAHGSDSIAEALGGHSVTVGTHLIGTFGVQIFFGLSGLLITTRLISSESRTGQISLKSFYIRRAFRILPASLAFLGVVGILAWVGVLPVSLRGWLSAVLFFSNYSTADSGWYLGHFWSLAVEEHFYFVWPLAFLLLKNSKRRIVAVIVFALLVAIWRAADLFFHITGYTSPWSLWVRSDIQADGIAWGVVFALLYEDAKWKPKLEQFLRQPRVVLGLLAALLGCLILPSVHWKLYFLLLPIRAAVIPLLILAVLINKDGVIHALLETPIFKSLGRLSYSIYLWQQLFLVWATAAVGSMSPLQTFPLNFIAALICASLSMFLIERPLIRFGHAL